MSLTRRALSLLAFLPLVTACGSDPETPEGEPPDGSEPSGQPTAADEATAEIIGRGDGSPASVELSVIYQPSQHPQGYLLAPTAMAWNSARPTELWVTLRDQPEDQPCNEGNRTGCTWLWGWMAIITNPGLPAPSVEVKIDDNAWHFMRRPTSIAFGDADLFATCAEARTSNYEDEDASFNGPVLWSSDPSIFGASGEGTVTNSTHIDMLHASPYCMGIAHERDNVYWTFNGDSGSLDRYDFHTPHEPGADDHSDGEYWRYVTGQVAREPNIPSQLQYDAETGYLYAADTGNHRIVRLDTKSGSVGDEVLVYERMDTHVEMTGAKLEVVIAPGRLGFPSGLTFHQGVMFVTDPPTSRVVAFDRAGRTVRELDTGLPGGALGAIGVSPEGKAYITDTLTGRVLRIEPR